MQKFDDADDPTEALLKSIPEGLKKYIREADPEGAGVEFVNRSEIYECCHMLMSVLCNVYSLCRMVLVREGQIALTWNGGSPEILPPGRHVLLSPSNTLDRVVNINEQLIIHGPIHIIRVGVGELGFGIETNTGSPVLMKTGKHVMRSATFSFKKFIRLTDYVTELGNLQLIRVETGRVAYCYKGGELQIMHPGIHVVAPPDRFGGFLSTQLSILELPNNMTHESSDYVPLKIKAAVFYRIDNPIKALTRIQDVEKQIRETAVSTLAGIIRSSSLADIARGSSQVKYESNVNKDLGKEDGPSAPPFYQHVHDEFIQKLADHVLEDWGIEIENIRIESLTIADPQLQQSISKQAIKINEQRSKYMMLQKQKDIIEAEASNAATQKRAAADADAGALLSVANAEAEAMIIRAKADKQAKILAGEGEAEYAALLNQTALGVELATLQLQKDCMEGVNQVMYVPHLPTMFQSGKGIFAMGDKTVMPEKL